MPTGHDHDPSQPDPIADRRRNSTPHHDAIDADLAARPKAPTHITRTRAIPYGFEVTIDDGHGTAIAITAPEPGRIAIGIGTDDRTLVVEFGSFTANVLDNVLRAVAGIGPGTEAPIVGSR